MTETVDVEQDFPELKFLEMEARCRDWHELKNSPIGALLLQEFKESREARILLNQMRSENLELRVRLGKIEQAVEQYLLLAYVSMGAIIGIGLKVFGWL